MENDTLTLTVRLHDPKEKLDASKSTSWKTAEIPREDLGLTPEEFAAKWLAPQAAELLASLKK
jgi:hypothetical protein